MANELLNVSNAYNPNQPCFMLGNLVHVGMGYAVGSFANDKFSQAIILGGFLLYEYSRQKPEVDKLIAVSEFLGGVWLGTSGTGNR